MAYVIQRHDAGIPLLSYWLATHEAEDRRICAATTVPPGATEEQINIAKSRAWSEFRKIDEQLQSNTTAARPSAVTTKTAPQLKPLESLGDSRQAAQQGDVFAQYNLGLSYFAGAGVAKDSGEAARWFRKSAEGGFARAQAFLGVLYGQGNGVPQDPTEAARWMRKAAEQGEEIAQVTVGEMYAKGEGVPQDYVEAHKWVNLAASRANGEDRQKWVALRDTIAGQMTAQQIGKLSV